MPKSPRDAHPLDVIEEVAHANEWAFERRAKMRSPWACRQMGRIQYSFSWMEDYEALHWPAPLNEGRANPLQRS